MDIPAPLGVQTFYCLGQELQQGGSYCTGNCERKLGQPDAVAVSAGGTASHSSADAEHSNLLESAIGRLAVGIADDTSVLVDVARSAMGVVERLHACAGVEVAAALAAHVRASIGGAAWAEG